VVAAAAATVVVAAAAATVVVAAAAVPIMIPSWTNDLLNMIIKIKIGMMIIHIILNSDRLWTSMITTSRIMRNTRSILSV
jgi:hypothetical protein